MMNRKSNKDKGITLIALVITIIVLLILAGVAISMLAGDNGILRQAAKAKEETEQAQQNETEILSGYEDVIDEIQMPTVTEPPTEEVNEKTKYNDIKSGKTAIIPKGFKVSDKEDEQSIDDGLVVIAPDGSEFVWVPVEDITTMYGTTADGKKLGKLYDFTSATEHKPFNWTEENGEMRWTLTSDTGSYREPDVLTDSSSGDWSTDSDRGINLLKTIVGLSGTNDSIKTQWTEQLQNEFDEMVTCVGKAKGFYIGRYEMSLRDGEKIVQVKQGETSATAASDSANTWYGLYQKAKEYAEKNNLTNEVGSSMIWGSQYDQMLIWMQKNRIDVTKGGDDDTRNTEQVTGNEPKDKLLNVYDLLGNSREWTLEANNTYIRVSRRRRLRRQLCSELPRPQPAVHCPPQLFFPSHTLC